LIINEYKEKHKFEETENANDEKGSSILIENEPTKILKEDSGISYTEPESEDSRLSLKENKKILLNNNSKENLTRTKKRSYIYSNSKDLSEPNTKMPRINKIKQ